MSTKPERDIRKVIQKVKSARITVRVTNGKIVMQDGKIVSNQVGKPLNFKL